ncbi:MAG: dUTP diphosphatase [Candidatus Andersenbacteria bacterium]
MVELKLKRLRPEAVLPTRHTDQDAGIDLYTCESVVLEPGQSHAFSTGFAAEFAAGYVALVRDRSSMGTCGIHVLGGVIDAGYRGEWKILLHNLARTPYVIKAGDRIAQVLLLPVALAQISEARELVGSARGSRGFGSSGR